MLSFPDDKNNYWWICNTDFGQVNKKSHVMYQRKVNHQSLMVVPLEIQRGSDHIVDLQITFFTFITFFSIFLLIFLLG